MKRWETALAGLASCLRTSVEPVPAGAIPAQALPEELLPRAELLHLERRATERARG